MPSPLPARPPRWLAASSAGGLAVAAGTACGAVEAPAPSGGSCADVELIAAGSTNYSSSVVCGAPGECSRGADLGVDPMLSTSNGRYFFLSRDNDLLFELDPSCGTPTSRLSVAPLAPRDPSTGRARMANPHDAAAAPDGTIVVALYDAARLAFLKDGALEDTSIDLSPYDADGNPQADAVSVVMVDGAAKAFVTLERLDDDDFLRSKQTSQMLRVDVATRSVEAVIDLAGRNPFNPMSELRGALFMAEPGNFDAADDELAGIERFDTATSTSRLLVRERDLGGSVAEVAVTEGCGAAIVAGPQPTVNPTAVVTFDPDTGEVLSTFQAPVLGPTPGYDLQGLAWRGDDLYVGDRRPGASGYAVHVFTRAGRCALTSAGRSLELPQSPVALRAARPPQPR
ncbi:MAG: hypothetical protein KF850_07975 [Labilithrix sp.]|nr:hypothetical protein [Labilithrix sp.]